MVRDGECTLPWSAGVISPNVLGLCNCPPLGLTESVASPARYQCWTVWKRQDRGHFGCQKCCLISEGAGNFAMMAGLLEHIKVSEINQASGSPVLL